jgi:hypothetical protein
VIIKLRTKNKNKIKNLLVTMCIGPGEVQAGSAKLREEGVLWWDRDGETSGQVPKVTEYIC